MIFPPGTILQRLYFKERLRDIPPGTFIEIGVGEGHWSQLLLDRGWTGTGYDIGPGSAIAAQRNARAISEGRYRIEIEDWLACSSSEKADMIFSAMVLEHLDQDDERRFLEKCGDRLARGGRLVLLVPASPAHWGVEDEIAGHFRRFTSESLRSALSRSGWTVAHAVGLTFPLSNFLLPISNRLVSRAEGWKTKLSARQRTLESGSRDVFLKTRFPAILGLGLNEIALYPFHMLQKIFIRNDAALVLYAECVPAP